MREPRSFSELIEAFGLTDGDKGEPNLVKVLGLPDSHIRTLKARDSIPPTYWPQLIAAAPKYGLKVDYPLLMKLRDRRFSKSGRAA